MTKEKLFKVNISAGDYYSKTAKYELALVHYKKALHTGIARDYVLAKLGNTYYNLNNIEEAVKFHRESLELKGWSQHKGYKFSKNCFYYKQKMGNWMDYLNVFKDKPCKVLEIGTREGMSACWLLENILTHKDSKIYCVDVEFHQFYNHNIQVSGFYDKVVSIEKPSHLINSFVSEKDFDLIYVDGSFYIDDVFIDCVNSFDKLKEGGIMIIDGYKYYSHKMLGGRPDLVAKIAIDRFLDIFQEELELLHKESQIILLKIKS